jgi:propanol-preferring alcohol dehydrogenase
MQAVRLTAPGPIETLRLGLTEIPALRPGAGQLLLRVDACAVCHTDLHLAEGELARAHYPVTPGHQVVGTVEVVGKNVTGWNPGERAGVAWLHSACGVCAFCRRGETNLCPEARFTGMDVDGGFAEGMVCQADFAFHLPPELPDVQAAPLLCAGIIGLRSLRKADLAVGERLGLIGFGASAHLALQVARSWDCDVHVFTRSAEHRRHALDLGASWAGGVEDAHPPDLDRAVLFAPVGDLVPPALRLLRPGGTLAINAIHLSPLPAMPYELLYGERTLRSVANATYQDGVDLLELAGALPLRVTTSTYALRDAGRALADVKHSRLDGAAVLLP